MREIQDIHEPFIRFLDQNLIPFHRNRPDKKTTAAKGDPDFLLTLANRCLYIECKLPGKKLSPDQEKRVAYLRSAGNRVVVAYSVPECVVATQTWAGVENNAGVPSVLCNWPLGKCFQAIKAKVAEAVPPTGTILKRNGDKVGPGQFMIGSWGGIDYVFAPDRDGAYCMIRKASAWDIVSFPKLSTP